jgi:transposase-like protein
MGDRRGTFDCSRPALGRGHGQAPGLTGLNRPATWLAQAHKDRVTDDDKIVVCIVMRSAHCSNVLFRLSDSLAPAATPRCSFLARLVLGWEVGWVLREMSVTERRYQAALAVLGGVPVTEVASRFGLGRQTVHRWLARCEAGRAGGAESRDSRANSPMPISLSIPAGTPRWRENRGGLPADAGRTLGLEPDH